MLLEKYAIVKVKEGFKLKTITEGDFLTWGRTPEETLKNIHSIKFSIGDRIVFDRVADKQKAKEIAEELLNEPNHIIEELFVKVRNDW